MAGDINASSKASTATRYEVQEGWGLGGGLAVGGGGGGARMDGGGEGGGVNIWGWGEAYWLRHLSPSESHGDGGWSLNRRSSGTSLSSYCPHKAKPVLNPLVAIQTRENFLCSMPTSGHPLEKGGKHEESLDRANKMQVLAILEWLTPKLDEVNDASSLGSVFQCYRSWQLHVINLPHEFLKRRTQNNGIVSIMGQKGAAC